MFQIPKVLSASWLEWSTTRRSSRRIKHYIVILSYVRPRCHILKGAMGLQFDKISHRYGTDEVLHEVILTVRAGEITCLLGPSGSGKSTLLRLAAGLERVQAGTISLDGELLAGPGTAPPPEQRPVGLVFQDHVLFPHMTVRANVEFGLRKLAARARHRHVDECMALVGLDELAERFPDTLSGGERQRVALARALAPKPRAILLDEPFASVDATLRRSLREDARRTLRATDGITLLVTHDPEEALDLADHIAVLEQGRIVQAGDPSEIWHAPADKTVAGLFGHAQHLRGIVKEGIVTTAFGVLNGEGFHDGAVDVVVRPSAVTLHKALEGLQVTDVRFLGDRYSVVVEGGTEMLRATTTERPQFAINDFVSVHFGQNDTFVYNRK